MLPVLTTVYVTVPTGLIWMLPAIALLSVAVVVKFLLRMIPFV